MSTANLSGKKHTKNAYDMYPEQMIHTSKSLNTPTFWKDWDEHIYKETRDRIDTAMKNLQSIHLGPKTPNPYAMLTPNDDEDASEIDDESDSEANSTHKEPNEDEREEDDAEGGEWEQVVRKPKGLPVLKHAYSQKQCRMFSAMYNAYFKVLTGKDLNFVITPSSQPFVSAFEACIERDQLLATLFNERPVIVDPMGGSGSDTISMLFNLYPKLIITCEWVYIDDKEDTTGRDAEYNTLKRNIENMRRLFPEFQDADAPEIRNENMDCKIFLEGLDLHFNIDILYLDPNWANGWSKSERTPTEMISYLKESVFDPLNKRKIEPKCIIFKTRWGHENLRALMKELSPNYHPMYSIEATPFREKVDEVKFEETGEVHGRFHWVVIVHNELKTIHWKRSQVYMDLLRNGKDVTVAKADFIRPHIPLYSNNIRIPRKRERSDNAETITVIAPKHSQTRATKNGRPAKARQGHNTHKNAR